MTTISSEHTYYWAALNTNIYLQTFLLLFVINSISVFVKKDQAQKNCCSQTAHNHVITVVPRSRKGPAFLQHKIRPCLLLRQGGGEGRPSYSTKPGRKLLSRQRGGEGPPSYSTKSRCCCYVISTLVLILQVLMCISWYYIKVYCTKVQYFVKYQKYTL